MLGADTATEFWGFFTRARRRSVAPVPTPSRRDAEAEAPVLKVRLGKGEPIASLIVSPKQTKLHQRVEAQRLAQIYIRSLAGDYFFRTLKDGFDEAVSELGIDPSTISDKRFATWLKEAGCKRRRIQHENWTMYRVPANRPATRSGTHAMEARC